MKPIGVAPRAIALVLCFALVPPSPAFALRIKATSEASGLEELTATLAGLEEESGLPAYHQAFADWMNRDGIFRIELDEKGIIQNLIWRTPKLDGFRISLHLSGEVRFHSYKDVRLLHYDPNAGLVSMRCFSGIETKEGVKRSSLG